MQLLHISIGLQPSLSSNSNGRTIIHDIPIRIIPSRLWDEYKEPDIPEFEVSVYLPPLKIMKTVIERLKNISNALVSVKFVIWL